MPKDNSAGSFSISLLAPYLSVVTPSTHDMSTIRGWWEEDRNKNTESFLMRNWVNGVKRRISVTPGSIKPLCNNTLHSPAMWSIFQLQDLIRELMRSIRRENPNDERINVPAIPKLLLESTGCIFTWKTLSGQSPFNEQLREMVKSSGR